MDKKLFIECIEGLEKQYRHDEECAKAFKVLLPNDFVSGYSNHYLENTLIHVLQKLLNDDKANSWIEYYCWELDFGNKFKPGMVKINDNPVNLKTPSDLYNLITTSHIPNT